MTRDEVRAFIAAELRRIARAGLIALLIDKNPRHPAALFVKAHGAQAVAESMSIDAIRNPAIGKPAAEAWFEATVDKLTFDACQRLAQDQRTLVAIREALQLPRG